MTYLSIATSEIPETNTRVFQQAVTPVVGGIALPSASSSTVEVINPSTGQQLLLVPAGCQEDVDRAVRSARTSFDDGRWSEAPISVRKQALHRLAHLLAANAASLDAMDAGEMGKPVSETLFNATAAAGLMHFYAEAVDKVLGDVYPSDRTTFVAQRRVPRGVVAAVVPWNFPTYNAVLKVAPALAAGNCVVLKPSELASRSAIHLTALAIEAGIPPGVLNTVPGLGETVGRALALHEDVDMVAFTGSTEVGKRMLQYAGQSNLKLVMAECGGKSPQVVFADGVDLDAAADTIARHLLANQGQICSVGSRLLVQRAVEAPLVQRIAQCMQRVVIGDALDSRTTFGPLASAKQCARVERYIKAAKRDGASLVAGGRRVLAESGGYFVEPTLFTGVAPRARIAREEVFGPVLAVIPFEDEAEAIEIANDTTYGLAAYVWTAHLGTGMRVAKAIRASVFINAAAPAGEGAGHAASYEPARQSGLGVESGVAGMEGYLRRQLLWFNHG